MKHPVDSEIIICPTCRKEKELKYDSYDCLISEEKCRCSAKFKTQKPLDVAFKELDIIKKGNK